MGLNVDTTDAAKTAAKKAAKGAAKGAAKPTEKEEKNEELVESKEAKARAMVASDVAQNYVGFLSAGEETGNTGMELDRNSFPMVVLNGSDFTDGVSGDPFELEGADLHKSFVFKVVAYRDREVYVITPDGSKDDGEFYVLTDKDTFHTGEAKADVLAVAESEGADIQHKKYTDYTVIMFKSDDEDLAEPLGLVSLSIPPSSRGRVAGAILTFNVTHADTQIDHPGEAIIKAEVGKKISKGTKSYHPWKFSVTGKA